MLDLSAQIILGRWVPHELSHKQFWSANCCESQFMDVIHAPTSFTLQNNKRCTEEQNCETYLQNRLAIKNDCTWSALFWSIEKANRPVFSVCRADEDETSKISCLLFSSYINLCSWLNPNRLFSVSLVFVSFGGLFSFDATVMVGYKKRVEYQGVFIRQM
jgi:hypothetical protein